MPVTLVLNSYYFVEDIISGTLQELASEPAESPLFTSIRESGHRILITERGARASIKRQYEIEAVKRGLGPQLVVVFDQLKAQGVVINSNPPRIQISNLGGHHRIFIEDAVAAQAGYFITEYEPWQKLNRNKQICPNLRIVTGRQFVRMARQIDR
jgi:hypothetical protein